MLRPHVIGRKDRHELRRGRGSLNRGAPICFLALYQTHRTNHFESEFACGFDRLNRGSARGADIIHNHDWRPFFAKALDAPAGSVLFFAFANEKTMNAAARHRDGDDDWICAHRQSANGLRLPAMRANFLQKHLASESRAASV